MNTLAPQVSALAWEARGAWATGREVILSLDTAVCSLPEVRGYIAAVSSTDAFVLVHEYGRSEPIHVPLDGVLALTRSHFHQEGWRPREARVRPGQAAFDGQIGIVSPLPVSKRATRAMARAAQMMLSADQLEVLAAVDRAPVRSPVTSQVAQEVGRSRRWTAVRLRRLEVYGLVVRVRGPGERRWRVGA